MYTIRGEFALQILWDVLAEARPIVGRQPAAQKTQVFEPSMAWVTFLNGIDHFGYEKTSESLLYYKVCNYSDELSDTIADYIKATDPYPFQNHHYYYGTA